MFSTEVADQTAKYGAAIANELERIRTQVPLMPNWASCTAVMVPGQPRELAEQLLEATKAAATAEVKLVLDAVAPSGASAPSLN